MSSLGLTHTVAALTALVAGAAVLLTRKGTRRHRWQSRGILPPRAPRG